MFRIKILKLPQAPFSLKPAQSILPIVSLKKSYELNMHKNINQKSEFSTL